MISSPSVNNRYRYSFESTIADAPQASLFFSAVSGVFGDPVAGTRHMKLGGYSGHGRSVRAKYGGSISHSMDQTPSALYTRYLLIAEPRHSEVGWDEGETSAERYAMTPS